MKLYKRENWIWHSPEDLGASSCVFCQKAESEKEYILWQWYYWFIVHNKYPYLWLEEHIMAIPLNHYKLSHEIPPEAYAEMSKVHSFIKDFYWDRQYFSFTRETFGDRSLEHLHMHFLPWIVYSKEIEALLEKQGF